jgi:WD40 repeat protein
MTGESTNNPERSIAAGEDGVCFMSEWEGRLISGHSSGRLRVWNVVTGACDQVLEGHTRAAHALTVCGSRLASGSADMSIRVWAMSVSATWTCERTLTGHTGCVWSLVKWQDKVLSGSMDTSIRVWDVGTGTHEATLLGHTNTVYGLAVHGDRLFSASRDGTIWAWQLGTWVGLRTVEAYGRGPTQYPRCLAVSGSQLISGLACDDLQDTTTNEIVQVWSLETLDLQHTLLLPAGEEVYALLAVKRGVWAGIGNDVMVWGRGT